MNRAIWILAVLLSHWRRHPMQLATLLVGLISATALWSGVQALNQQARLSYDRAAATFGGALTATLVGREGATFPQQLFIDLRRAGWPVSPVLEGEANRGVDDEESDQERQQTERGQIEMKAVGEPFEIAFRVRFDQAELVAHDSFERGTVAFGLPDQQPGNLIRHFQQALGETDIDHQNTGHELCR